MPIWSIPAIAKVGTWLGIGKAALGGAAALGVASSLGSSAAQYGFGRQAMRDQAGLNEYMYRNRYQWTMQDMRNAGLNPILAAKGGLVGSSPQVGLPQVGRGEFTTSSKEVREIDNINQDTKLKLQQAYHEVQRNYLTRRQAGVAHQKEEKLANEVRNTIMEFERIKQDILRLEAATNREQADVVRINQQAQVLRREATKLMNLMTQLEQESELYKGVAGRLLKAVKETFDALNLHIVVGTGIK